MGRRMAFAVVLAAACVVAFTGSALAATIYYDESAFLADVAPNYYLEDFVGYAYGSYIAPSLPLGPVNGFSYTITAPGPGSNDLFSGDSNMSTNSAQDDLLVTFTGDPVTAVGGFFFAGDIDGYYIPGSVTVTLSDGTSETYSPPDSTTFLGFTAGVPLSTILIAAPDTAFPVWPTMDHFYVGEAQADDLVPEPATMVLMGSGLVGLLVRRRRHKK